MYSGYFLTEILPRFRILPLHHNLKYSIFSINFELFSIQAFFWVIYSYLFARFIISFACINSLNKKNCSVPLWRQSTFCRFHFESTFKWWIGIIFLLLVLIWFRLLVKKVFIKLLCYQVKKMFCLYLKLINSIQAITCSLRKEF